MWLTKTGPVMYSSQRERLVQVFVKCVNQMNKSLLGNDLYKCFGESDEQVSFCLSITILCTWVIDKDFDKKRRVHLIDKKTSLWIHEYIVHQVSFCQNKSVNHNPQERVSQFTTSLFISTCSCESDEQVSFRQNKSVNHNPQERVSQFTTTLFISTCSCESDEQVSFRQHKSVNHNPVHVSAWQRLYLSLYLSCAQSHNAQVFPSRLCQSLT